MTNVQRTADVRQLLDVRIASEKAAARGPSSASLVLYALSVLPLILLITCVFWLAADKQTTWVAAVMTIGCLTLTFTIWQFGSHLAKQLGNRLHRIHQLEDLQIYFASVPEEEWPAKEMLKIVLKGREQWYTDTSIDFSESSVESTLAKK